MSQDAERAAVRRLLRHWGSIPYLCRRKQNEIAEYRGLIDAAEEALGAQVLTGLPRGTDAGDPTAQAAAMAERLKAAYMGRMIDAMEDIDGLLTTERTLGDIIGELPEQQQLVLEYRYKRRWSWQRTAQRMRYSEQNAKKIESDAVNALVKEIEVKTF